MYWNRLNAPNVSRLAPEDDDYNLVVRHLDFQYKLGLEAALGMSRSDSAKNPSPVVQMKKKPLTFYRDDSSVEHSLSQTAQGGRLPYSAIASSSTPAELFEVEVNLSVIEKRFGDTNLTNF